MMQAHPVPYVDARGSLAVESVPAGAVALLGAYERHNEIELGTGIYDPANAAKNSIHFSKCSETIDIDGLQAGGLRQQFFVRHFGVPRQWKPNHDREVTLARWKTETQPQELLIDPSASLSLHFISEFVAATPSDECAPVADALTPPVPTGASNSIITPDSARRA